MIIDELVIAELRLLLKLNPGATPQQVQFRLDEIQVAAGEMPDRLRIVELESSVRALKHQLETIRIEASRGWPNSKGEPV